MKGMDDQNNLETSGSGTASGSSQDLGRDPVGGQQAGGGLAQTQPVQPKPSYAKETEVGGGGAAMVETAPVVEIKEQEVPDEVAEYVAKVDKENSELEKNVIHKGQPVLSPTSGNDQVIVLPLTKEEMEKGLHTSVKRSVRWLAEWAYMIYKKFYGSVVYSKGKD